MVSPRETSLRNQEGFALVVLDAHGEARSAEGDCRRFFGRAGAELVGRRFSPMDDPRTDDAMRAALSGQSRSIDLSIRGLPAHVLFEPLADGGGAVVLAIDMQEERCPELGVQLRALLSQAPGAVWTTDRDLRFTYAVGLVSTDDWGAPHLAVGRTLQEFLGTTEPTDAAIACHLAALAGMPKSFRYSFHDHVLQCCVEPLRDQGGEIVGVIGACVDVTERVATEAELATAKALLEGVIDATADGILVIDRDGRVTRYNPQFLALWRVPRDVAERRCDAELLAIVREQLEDPAAFERGVRDVYEMPERESFDVLRFADGRVYERKSIPQRIGDTIVGRVWSFRDVTEREHALTRTTLLNDAARLLGSLDLDQALDAVAHLAVPYLGDACAIDVFREPAGRRRVIAFANRARAIDPEIHPAVLAGHRTTYTVGAIAHLGVPLSTNGRVLGAITFVARPQRRYALADIQAAEELARRCALVIADERALREARTALRARDEFLGVVAHEFRGPLTSIHVAAEGLARGNLPENARVKMLAAIQREDRRLARFIDDLVEVAEARAGELSLDLQSVNLTEVVAGVVSQMAAEIAASGSSVATHSRGPVIGEWDRHRLEQVVGILLSNAVRYGLGRPIELRLEATDGVATLRVRDYGTGIPPGMRERIFQPFERGVSARHYGGLGLGLFVARSILDGLGGAIRVENDLQSGSAFVVTLPQKRKRG